MTSTNTPRRRPMLKSPYNLPENKLFYQTEADNDFHIFLKKEPYLLEVPHYHNSLEFAYIDQAETVAHISNHRQKMAPGDICFIDSYQIHSFEYSSLELSAISLVVSEKYTATLKEVCGGKSLPTFMTDKEKNRPAIEILKEWEEIGSQSFLLNCAYANRFYDALLKAYELQTPESSALNQKAIDFLNYINAHYTEPISIRTMAEYFGYSEGRCSYLFNSYVGISFKACLNEVRMQNALSMIATKKYSMNEVIERSGFGSSVTFYRHYAAHKEKQERYFDACKQS